MGKWSAFKQSLPAKVEDQTYQDTVNQAKHQILLKAQEEGRDLDLGYIGDLYGRAREEKEKIENELSGCNLIIAALEQMTLQQFDAQQMDMFRLDDGSSISRKDDVYTALEDQEKFLAWIDKTGKRSLLSVHYQTMNSLAKQMLENNEELPPGIKAFFRQGLTFRRARKS